MKTVADYWEEACTSGSGSLGRVPPQTQQLYLMVFLGGFAACIDTMANLANLSDEEAEQHMRDVNVEMAQMREKAVHTLFGGTIQ